MPLVISATPNHCQLVIASWKKKRAPKTSTRAKPNPAVTAQATCSEIMRNKRVKAMTDRKPTVFPTTCHHRKPCQAALSAEKLEADVADHREDQIRQRQSDDG